MGDRHDKRQTDSILNSECSTTEVKTQLPGWDSQELSLGESKGGLYRRGGISAGL